MRWVLNTVLFRYGYVSRYCYTVYNSCRTGISLRYTAETHVAPDGINKRQAKSETPVALLVPVGRVHTHFFLIRSTARLLPMDARDGKTGPTPNFHSLKASHLAGADPCFHAKEV